MAHDTPHRHLRVTPRRPDDPEGPPVPGVFVIGQRVTQGGTGHVLTIRELAPDGRVWCTWQSKRAQLGDYFDVRDLVHVT